MIRSEEEIREKLKETRRLMSLCENDHEVIKKGLFDEIITLEWVLGKEWLEYDSWWLC